MSRYKVRNWSEYNKSLKNRGSLSFWISEDAIKKWKAVKDPHFIGAPLKYSDEAILCLMMIKVIYHLPYRQLVGFLVDIFRIMGVDLPIPHFTTIAERARSLGKPFKRLSSKLPTDLVFDASGFKIYGEGEWKVRQHGKQKRRRWKKFHIAMCPQSHEIIVAEATELEEADCKVMPRLLRRAPRSVKRTIGDGAFDTSNCYKAAYEFGVDHIAPPRRGAVMGIGKEKWHQMRDDSISEMISLGADDEGRALWKKLKGYHQRSLAETSFSRMKGIFGEKLFSKSIDSQSVELYVKSYVLNQMTKIGMPKGKMI